MDSHNVEKLLQIKELMERQPEVEVEAERDMMRYWCPSRRCRRVIISSEPICPHCHNGMILISDLDGNPTEHGRQLLAAITADNISRAEWAQAPRKQGPRRVQTHCPKCRRVLVEYVVAGKRIASLLSAHHPTKMVRPGVEVCCCS